ncbi:MAG: MAPEG family protein [Roseiarcus sp.]|jgi:glutathione S-transferase
MPHFTALATLLAVLFYATLGAPVGRARARSGIRAPTMVGDPGLERAVRIQANTLEWMPIFLPALWLAAITVNDPGAAALGLVWIAGRALYARDYAQSPEKRGRGYAIQAVAAGLLWAAALVGVVRAMLTAM